MHQGRVNGFTQQALQTYTSRRKIPSPPRCVRYTLYYRIYVNPDVFLKTGMIHVHCGVPFLTFIFYLFLAPKNIVKNKEKKILAKPPRHKKTFRGRFRRLRQFYFNFDYFFLVIMILRYFY